MNNFDNIPINDILYFLKYHNVQISTNNWENYKSAWNLIISNQELVGPESVVNWINNYNLSTLNILPDDIVIRIMKQLSCKEVSLMCSSSKRLQSLCDTNVLSDVISNTTEWIGENKNKEELLTLCKLSTNNNNRLAVSGGKVLFIGNDNLLYSVPIDKDEVPKLVDNKKFISIDSNENAALLLGLDQKVYIYGNTSTLYNELRLGIHGSFNIPTLIPNLENIIQISVNKYNAYALNDKGEFYIPLDKSDYTDNYINEFVLLEDVSDIVKISSNEKSTLLLQNNNTIIIIIIIQ